MDWNLVLKHLVAAVLFGTVGIVMFFGALAILRRMLPFSMDKELSEDHNIALAIVVAAMLLGLAIILSSAISS